MKNILLLFVTVVTLFALPNKNFAQTPFLGLAKDYVLFTSAGAITNTGRSHFTGNIGTNVGAVTGFSNIDGVMNPANKSLVATDLAEAYLRLDTMTGGSPHSPALGGGDTLTRGVYDIPAAAVLGGNLVLDGGGDENAVFIFRIEGTLATSPFSAVVLSNGTLACNVFWKVDGAVSLLDNSTMKGTIISIGRIDMSSGANLEGRALSTQDAIGVTQVTARTPIGCGSPHLTGPVAPLLGVAGQFALFTGVGAISNAGTSKITGDVGSADMPPSGFVADDVNGMIHAVPDNVTTDAKRDLLNVYDYLNTLPPDIELTDPAEFGHGLVLTPHTYHMGAAPRLNDTVFLNAQGDPDAVFVIQINGALTTTTNSVVMLVNGTQAKNVYWKIDGAVEIATGSKFAGTMVVNGAIDLTSGVLLAGRALSNNGAVSTASVTTTMLPDGTLPVTWLSFTGKPLGQSVLLEWVTANEVNNGFFTILKSRDGRNFQTLTTIPAHGEQKNSQYHYSFTDKLPYTDGYYSILQTDNDGKKSSYKSIRVKVNINESFKATHYVQQNYIYVKASGLAPASGMMRLFTVDGRLVSSQTIMLTRDASTFKITRALQKGIYVVQLESQGVQLYNKKVAVF